MSSNLPPGVRECDIPGNRPIDREWGEALDTFDSYNLTKEEMLALINSPALAVTHPTIPVEEPFQVILDKFEESVNPSAIKLMDVYSVVALAVKLSRVMEGIEGVLMEHALESEDEKFISLYKDLQSISSWLY